MNFGELGEISNGKRSDTITRKKMKLTVHRTGRAGFSAIAGEVMELSKDKKILFAVRDQEIYAMLTVNDERGYDIRNSANYFSIDLRPLLDKLGVDYTDKEYTTIFDIERHGQDDAEGATIWRLIKRVVKANNSRE